MLAAVKSAGRPRRGADPCDSEGLAPREGATLAALIVEEKPICRLAICGLVADVLGSGEVGFASSMLEATASRVMAAPACSSSTCSRSTSTSRACDGSSP